MRFILPGAKEEQYRQLQWLGDYSSKHINSHSYINNTINSQNQSVADLFYILYEYNLGCLLQEFIFTYPILVPVYII